MSDLRKKWAIVATRESAKSVEESSEMFIANLKHKDPINPASTKELLDPNRIKLLIDQKLEQAIFEKVILHKLLN